MSERKPVNYSLKRTVGGDGVAPPGWAPDQSGWHALFEDGVQVAIPDPFGDDPTTLDQSIKFAYDDFLHPEASPGLRLFKGPDEPFSVPDTIPDP